MDSDEVTLQCPCCSSTLGIDDSGDLYSIDDQRQGSKGIGGIRTHHVGGENWSQDRYIAYEPKQYQVPAMMITLDKSSMHQSSAPPVEDKEYPDVDSSVLEAHDKDLKQRNILTDTNDL